MNFIEPSADELSRLRADPLLWEQELDVRPEFAEAVEQACGKRAGRAYFRSEHDHLYAIELADLGRGRPSMAMLLGFWERWEPRPPEHEIDLDLLWLCDWLARIGGLDSADVAKVAARAGIAPKWPDGSVLRTPDERFASLPGFPYGTKYIDIEGLRMAYVECGEGDPILLIHGEPTWGYLFRRMIPALSKTCRVIVPDLIGFGRSDKPVSQNAHSYKSHVRWMRKFISALDLRRITVVAHDWGRRIMARVVADMPDRFAGSVGELRSGDLPGALARDWRRYVQRAEVLDVAGIVQRAVARLTDEEAAAYQAPFPSKDYQAGPLVLPRLFPAHEEDAGVFENRDARARLKALDLPVLVPLASGPELRSGFQKVAPMVPRSLGLKGSAHFAYEDSGEDIAGQIVKWMEERRV